jgi:hypothetical protein
MPALPQRPDQRRTDALVVLDHQELGHGATLTPRRPGRGDAAWS